MLLRLEECQKQNVLSVYRLAKGIVSQITGLFQTVAFLLEMGFGLHNH